MVRDWDPELTFSINRTFSGAFREAFLEINQRLLPFKLPNLLGVGGKSSGIGQRNLINDQWVAGGCKM